MNIIILHPSFQSKSYMTKNLLKASSIVLFLFIVTGCSSSYRTINPSKLSGYTIKESNGIELDYQPAALNGQYLKHQQQTGYGLYAVRVTNNTSKPISIKNNVVITASGKTLSYMELNVFYNFIQQNPERSLQFLFLLPLNGYTKSATTEGSTTTSSSTHFYPVGVILGPALAFGNLAAAKGANEKFKAELDKYDILNKEIGVGKTEFGIIALNENPLNPLELVISK